METTRNLTSTLNLLLMISALGVVVCPAGIAVAQDRTYMDGFDPEKGVLFEAQEPGTLYKTTSPDGQLRAKTEYGSVRVRSVEGNELLHTFSTSGSTYSPAFTPDGRSLVAAVCRGNLGCISTLYSWDLKTGERTRVGECSGLVLDMSFDAKGKRLAVATFYGEIGAMALYDKYKKWFAGEIVIIDTEKPESSVRIFCELSGVPDVDKESVQGRDPKEVHAELDQRLHDAHRRCLPVRVGLTSDGTKVVGITSSGVMLIFDAQTGKSELLLNSKSRAGSEAITSIERTRESSESIKKEQGPAKQKRIGAQQSPRAVVARWLELHRTGKRDEASALTTGSPKHRADVLLSSKRDTGVRVMRSLGNERVAAVVASSRDDAREARAVLLFWLVRRDGAWRINKSGSFKRAVVDERLRGFLEAGDVRWHVQRDQLSGSWEAHACLPPGSNGVTACGSKLQFVDNNRYRSVYWGPGAPDPDDVMKGKWRVTNDKILLLHQDRTFECVVTWLGDDQLEIESADGRIRVVYKRTIVDQPAHQAAAAKEGIRFPLEHKTASPDGKLFAGYYRDGLDEVISIHDAKTGKQLKRIVGHGDEVTKFKFTPDGRFLASRCVNSGRKGWALWGVSTGKLILRLKD